MKDYIKYAFGEIFLIVIGILIALQINNWNEHRKNNNQKLLNLEILKQSFERNRDEIKTTLVDFDISLKTTNLRILNTGPKIRNISQSLIDSIRVIDIVKLELVDNISSHFQIDSKNASLFSKELRNLLLKYSSFYTRYKNSEDNAAELALRLRENHQKHITLLNEITPDNNLQISPYNSFNSNYINWLRDRTNQNISVESKWKIEQSIFQLKKLNKLNTIILETLKKEIEK